MFLRSAGRVRGRRHRDPLPVGGTRVLHQGDERWAEEERHCALFTAGWRENTSFITMRLLQREQCEAFKDTPWMWSTNTHKYYRMCFIVKECVLHHLLTRLEHTHTDISMSVYKINTETCRINIVYLLFCSNGWFCLQLYFEGALN